MKFMKASGVVEYDMSSEVLSHALNHEPSLFLYITMQF